MFGLCQGCEDLNDHDRLRQDLALQTALEKKHEAASSPTLCRFENRADWAAALASTHRILIDQFIACFDRTPEELVFDFDATDDPVHGQQERRHFSGYHDHYDHYCFLPLYVFCAEQLLVAYLRSGQASTRRCTRRRSSSCWSNGCARPWPRGEDHASAGIAVSAARCCCPGASAITSITWSGGWPGTRACSPTPQHCDRLAVRE